MQPPPLTTIRYIEDPTFEVDFRRFSAEQSRKTTDTYINRIESEVFFLISLTFWSVARGLYDTTRSLGKTFRYIVIYGTTTAPRLPTDIYVLIFRVILWAAATQWAAITSTLRYFATGYIEAHGGFSNILEPHANSEKVKSRIDLSHFRFQLSQIDASGVPDAITLDRLLDWYDQIVFNDRKSLHYKKHPAESNREGLEKFVKTVKGGRAFLGTPPAHNAVALERFYRQITNAVRVSMHRVQQKMDVFKARMWAEGKNPDVLGKEVRNDSENREFSRFTDQEKNEYQNLFEDLAKIATDLSIAGKYCGARFMGEALSLHHYTGGSNVSSEGKTLEENLREILAHGRKEIAERQVQRYMSSRGSVDTHNYTKYMSQMGVILSLPGVEDVIEYLSGELDTDKYLELFFKEYTVNYIIDLINETVKKSQSLRERIIDWVRDQYGDWKRDFYDRKVSFFYELLSAEGLLERPRVLSDNTMILLGQFILFLKSYTKNGERFDFRNEPIESIKAALEGGLGTIFFAFNESKRAALLQSFDQISSDPSFSFVHEMIDDDRFVDIDVEPIRNALKDFRTLLPKKTPIMNDLCRENENGRSIVQDFKENLISWDDFLDEFFSHECTKQWRDEKYSGQLVAEKRENIRKIKNLLQKEVLGKRSFELLQKKIFEDKEVSNEKEAISDEEIDKIVKRIGATKRIMQAIPLSLPQARSVEKGKSRQLIADLIEIEKRNEFTRRMPLNDLKENGLSPALMEWVLVANHVLKPQQIQESE
jgi:hypothetical protein